MKYLVELIVCSIMLIKCTHQFKVAIVGGGIGGTSCAYFLRDIFNEEIKIDIYEGNKVGGRLATAMMNNGVEYEAGGSIIHQRNKYMSEFVNDLGLDKRTSAFENVKLGVYNGKDFDFIESDNQLLNLMKIVWRYGYSAKRLQDFVNGMLDKFERIYEIQSSGKSFSTTHELITAMDPSFVNYLKISVKDAYSKNEGFSESLISDLVQASLRVNYGQNVNVHEFVGTVSMAGMDGSLWAVKGGNKKVAEKLLKIAKAKLIHDYVVQITKNNKTFTLVTKKGKTSTYDYVVFAAPLAENQKVPIIFSNISYSKNHIGKYHRTVTTLVDGEIKRKQFSPLSDDYSPFAVISNNNSEFFNSISNVQGVNETPGANVWKVFSQEPLTKIQIDHLFQSTNDVKIVDWLAYPHYQVPTESQSFRISDRLYHINAIEWVASAMEMSCIGAKNVALLIMKDYYDEKQNKINMSRLEL